MSAKAAANKIDMVYLWCDGNEPAFKARREFYGGKKAAKKDNVGCGDGRYHSNDELRFSLRSVEKFASFVNHVYIVTDRQVPDWLNTNYEKVSIVDHSEIIPKELIPVFNAGAIERHIPYIPNLSEKFLYSNDDMFFGRKVSPEDFFSQGKPIFRVELSKYDFSKSGDTDVWTPAGVRIVTENLLKTMYPDNYFSKHYNMHHNIDPYTKTCFIQTLERYKFHLAECNKNRFRRNNDIDRTLFALDAVFSGLGILKVVSNPKPWRRCLHFLKDVEWESYVAFDDTYKWYKELFKFRPKFFCINAGYNTTKEDKIKAREILEKYFPEKSKFEL